MAIRRFQSTPPHGGATCSGLGTVRYVHCFNPRPRTGGRPRPWRSFAASRPFQSTPPHGGATASPRPGPHDAVVSIHAPARGGDPQTDNTVTDPTGFNPRPRTGGRRGRPSLRTIRAPVSIHAPARGGDLAHSPKNRTAKVSIHAPARGGDRFRARWSSRPRSFNPRPRTGGRLPAPRLCPSFMWFQSTPPHGGATRNRGQRRAGGVVSIHAPARGGDLRDCRALAPGNGFNPRPRTGGRPRSSKEGGVIMAFQSTPPHGGATAPLERGKRCTRSFNPRPRTGGRPRRMGIARLGDGFNPRPRTGGRPVTRQRKDRRPHVSIHAPARGGDQKHRKEK